MSILSKRKVRFACDYRQVFATSGLVDVYTGQVIETVRGNATRFEIGFFEGATPLDLDDVESINLKIQPSQTTDGVLADQTIVSWDLTLTAETWADGTQQHAVFEFSNAEMNIDPGGAARGLWLVVTAIMLSGDEVTLAAGTLNLHEDNNGSLAEPPESPGAYLTVDQGDVRYVGYNPQERSATAQWQARNNIAANGLVHTQEHLNVYDPTADVGLVLTRLPATNEASAEPYLSDYDLPTWKGFFGVYAYLVYARAEIDGKTNVWCLHDPWNVEHPYIADGSYDCRSTLPWDLVFDLKWDGEALVTLPTTGTATPQEGVQGADPRLFDERIPTAEGMVDKINATEDASAADTDRLAVVVAGALRWMSLSTLWTWIKAKIDLGQTWAGVHAFSSTTRPTSAGTGTPGATSLITHADAGPSSLASGVRHWPTFSTLVRNIGALQLSAPGELNIDTTNTAGTVIGGIYSTSVFTPPMLSMAGDAASVINFNRRHRISCEAVTNGGIAGTAVVWFVNGCAHNTTSAAQPAVPGFGFKLDSAGIRLWVYGAGGYAESAATAFASGVYHAILLDYLGGDLNGWLNGVALPSLGGGPSGNSALNFASSAIIAATGATNERVRMAFRFPKSLTTAS